MNKKVIDLSHHNTIPSSLVPAYNEGVRGVIHKLTEGIGFVDSKADARFYLAKEAKMLWGLYHFLRPGNMQKQAEFFLKTAEEEGVLEKDTLLAADHEDPAVPVSDLYEWLVHVEEMSGRSPVIYSGHVLKEQLPGPNTELSKYRLWLAQYASSPTLPPGWNDYYLWQYTDKGDVAGVSPPTDLNDYKGNDLQLSSSWSGRRRPELGTITITITVPDTPKNRKLKEIIEGE